MCYKQKLVDVCTVHWYLHERQSAAAHATAESAKYQFADITDSLLIVTALLYLRPR